MDLELEGRVFLVTGATDGLGLALTRSLVSEGARVVGCGRSIDRLDAARDLLGDAAVLVQADVTVLGDLQRMVDEALGRWDRIDGVVNNAGRSAAARLADLTDENWADDLNLKVMAAVRLTRLCLPHLRTAPGASVVNVLAIAAKAPPAGSMPTAASRAAGMAITKSLSKELGPDDIRVNAVLVGLVESGQWERLASQSGRSTDEIYADLSGTVPLGRVGRASEFADLVSYLLSARASYVTGCAINLDGGASPVV